VYVFLSIGNDGSAFVEALVSRSGDDGDNYEVSFVCCVSFDCGFVYTRYCWLHPVLCHQQRVRLGLTLAE